MTYLSGIWIGFVGLATLAGFLIIGYFAGRRDFGSTRIGVRGAALVFVPVWILGTGSLYLAQMMRDIHMPGFSMQNDGSFFLLEFVVPVTAAFIIAWRLRSRTVRN